MYQAIQFSLGNVSESWQSNIGDSCKVGIEFLDIMLGCKSNCDYSKQIQLTRNTGHSVVKTAVFIEEYFLMITSILLCVPSS
jgi:hypothetical protein